MRCCQYELTLDELLADPLTQAVMKADRVNRHETVSMLRSVAEGLAADQSPPTSVIGRLVGLLAAYYGAAFCGCVQPANPFRICKAS